MRATITVLCCAFAAGAAAVAGAATRPLSAAQPVASAPVFEARGLLRTPASLQSVEIADLDRDGRPDVVAGGGRLVVVLRNTGGGRFDVQRLSPMPSDRMKLADLDDDGRLDIVGAESKHGAGVAVAFARDGGFERRRRTKLDGRCIVGSLAAADVDGDGDRDVLAARYCSPSDEKPGSALAVLLNRGGRRGFDGPVFPTTVKSASELLAADLDRDGRLDLVAEHRLVRGLGGGAFARPRTILPTGPSHLALADVDGDGRRDILAGVSGSDEYERAPTLAVVRRVAGGSPRSAGRGRRSHRRRSRATRSRAAT